MKFRAHSGAPVSPFLVCWGGGVSCVGPQSPCRSLWRLLVRSGSSSTIPVPTPTHQTLAHANSRTEERGAREFLGPGQSKVFAGNPSMPSGPWAACILTAVFCILSPQSEAFVPHSSVVTTCAIAASRAPVNTLEHLCARRAERVSIKMVGSDAWVQDKVLDNGMAILTLNRPKALNAADQGITGAMLNKLGEWDERKDVRALLLQSSSERAFCSGGDVKAIAQDLKADVAAQTPYVALSNEYRLLLALERWASRASERGGRDTPSVAIMDGVTMGFGVGLACNARYRVFTERTLLAMPECAIGVLALAAADTHAPRPHLLTLTRACTHTRACDRQRDSRHAPECSYACLHAIYQLFPDIGFGWLTRHKPAAGLFLGLTGTRIGAKASPSSDLIFLGLGTHYVPSDGLPVS